ncbi:MAG: radical SAM protein [Acidobacteriota bacterium]|nr:radical SAM protein [Acidobacteriota bacterium]
MRLVLQNKIPRLPLDGSLDLTYRCNNSCRHCWLRLPPDAPEGREELALDEILRIVDEARRMGCQAWFISGGEPLLRPDFPEIFDSITRKSLSYSLNTNGTLITPEIARLLTRNGRKMIALYGATADVHDHVTRNPGSFEATLRGMAYLKEADADFIVQIVPMRANHHQTAGMVNLAHSLSPQYRVGASWLWMSACRSASHSHEIVGQRLDAADVIKIDVPNPAAEWRPDPDGDKNAPEPCSCSTVGKDDRLFAACIDSRRKFHIDPYGKMSFCCFIKDPDMRADLRRDSFARIWDKFIPSMAEKVRGGREYLENCGSCDLRRDCRWCAAYAYLEHGRFSAKIDYLCEIAAEARRFKEEWKQTHLQYYRIAGITIRISADFPLGDKTFAPIFHKFQVEGPGPDTISIRLASSVPKLSDLRLGKEVYRQPPWAIFRQPGSWVYLGITSVGDGREPYCAAIWNDDHSRGTICRRADIYEKRLHSLTTFTSDQILIARVLADRRGCYLHASGIIIDGRGFLFVGHSDAGKSTMMKMLRGKGEILCDDRIIVRRWPEGFRIHGTWSHGELPDVSPSEAPLQAIMFLEKADNNELIPIRDNVEKIHRLLSHVIKPLVTAEWWEKTMDLAESIAAEIPVYRLRFDKSGRVADLMKAL